MTSKRNQLRKLAVKQKKIKESLAKGRIARLEMVTGLEEVEQKRMMIFVRHIL